MFNLRIPLILSCLVPLMGISTGGMVPTLYVGEQRPSQICMLSLIANNQERRSPWVSSVDVRHVSLLIKIGEERFLDKLEAFGLRQENKNTSQVHHYGDIFGQAFLLTLSSLPYPDEIIWKSEITFASHWWDDLVDRSDGIPYERLEEFVKNPASLYAPEAHFALLWRLISECPDPNNALRAFIRLTYGGLIQRAPTREKRDKYLREYMEFSLEGVDSHVKNEIMRFRPTLFWMTSKTLFELMLQPDLGNRRTLSVLLDCLFGPAIYYHDAAEETSKGELKFSPDETPTPQEEAALIHAINGLLLHHELDSSPLRVQQLKYTVHFVSDRLPKEVASAYNIFLDQWAILSKLVRHFSKDSQVTDLLGLDEAEVMKALKASDRPALP